MSYESQALNLAIEQAFIEVEANEAGAKRFNESQARAIEHNQLSRTIGAQVAQKTIFSAVVDAVSEAIRTAPAASKASWKFIKSKDAETPQIGVERAVHIAMTAMFNSVDKRQTTVASAIGRQIGAELRAQIFTAQKPGLSRVIFKKVKEATTVTHKLGALNHAFERNEVETLAEVGFTTSKAKGSLDESTATQLGMKLIDTVVAKVGAFYLEEVLESSKGSTKTTYYLRASEELVELMADAEERAQWMRPVRPLMITPPRDWDANLNGGYATDSQHLEFLKGAPAGYLSDALESGGLDKVFSAMNVLQRTPYRINKRVFSVMKQAWSADLALGIMPTQKLLADIPKPNEALGLTVAEYKLAFPDGWKAWKKLQAPVYAHNRSSERISKILTTEKALAIGDEYLEREAVYFPVQNDFRGRMYYAPDTVNPQSSDLVKAMLEFSESVPMTEADGDQLAIVGATLWANGGLDKLPMADRVQWVIDNSRQICACARRPMDNLWWSEADWNDGAQESGCAWMFLAWCFAWNDWQTQGVGCMSSYIAFADGKCNGSQHHAALMGAEAEAGYVCMTPMETPDDLYGRVLTNVLTQVKNGLADDSACITKKADEETGEPESTLYTVAEVCAMLSGRLKRRHVKTPTMTFSYGVTMMGVREQLATDHADLFDSLPKNARKGVVGYLASQTMSSIKEVVKASAECMSFLQKVASVAGKDGLPVSWTTPDGFPVLQNYKQSDYIRVRTVISGDTQVKVDRSMLARKGFLKLAKGALKALGDAAVVKGVIAELDEQVSNTVFTQFSTAYKNSELELFKGALYVTFEHFVTAGVATLRALVDAVIASLEAVYGSRTESRKVDTQLRVSSDRLDVNKQINAMSPNFIHSLDACAMRMTINACAAEGITSFAGIHDSFGVHIGNYIAMNRILRAQFVKMYTESDPLQDLLDSVKMQVPVEEHDKLPSRPTKGTLDISLVNDAVFFFA